MSPWWRRLHVFSDRRQRRRRIRRVRVLGIEKVEDRRLLAGLGLPDSLNMSLLSETDAAESFEDFVPPDGMGLAADLAGFTLSKNTATVAESGTQDNLTVVLTGRPQSNVTLKITSSDTAEVSVSPASLTFTPADWDEPQTVTLTGVDDFVIDGSQSRVVTVSVDAASSDDAFDSLPALFLFVTTTDDDIAGLRLSKHTASVSESGTTDEFTVSLTAKPGSNVTVTVISGNPGEVTASPTLLIFTPALWNTPQKVTLTGVDDHWIDGSQETRVAVSVADGVSDGQFAGVAEESVRVTTADNDAAGFRLSKKQARVSENGTADTFTAVLTAQPLINVVLEVSSSDPGEATASPAALTFTPADWNSPQLVTITGVDDSERDGSQSSSVTVSVDDLNSDDLFDGVDSQVVSVSTSDNDSGWHNWENPYDVNGDDLVNASDVLIIVNYINDGTIAPALPLPPAAPPPYYDVNNDGLCTAIDVLIIINFINTYGLPHTSGGEGEGASRDATDPKDAAQSDEPTQRASASVPTVSTLPSGVSAGQAALLTATLSAGSDNRDLSDSDRVSRLAAPSSPAAVQQANEQRMPIRATSLGQRAACGAGQTRPAVFDAWQDERWDDLAGTLTPAFDRAG